MPPSPPLPLSSLISPHCLPLQRLYGGRSTLRARLIDPHRPPLRPFLPRSRTASDQAFDSLVQPPTSTSTATPAAAPSAHATSSAPPSPQIVFGSRLAGPAARPRYDVVDGRVPPRPEEPDNCCMSGCVNCVWDRYREELEAWAAAKATAEAAGARRAQWRPAPASGGGRTAAATGAVGASMDDDGGGSEALWSDADVSDEGQRVAEGLLGELPVGIREFMRQEKRLRERKRARQKLASAGAGDDGT